MYFQWYWIDVKFKNFYLAFNGVKLSNFYGRILFLKIQNDVFYGVFSTVFFHTFLYTLYSSQAEKTSTTFEHQAEKIYIRCLHERWGNRPESYCVEIVKNHENSLNPNGGRLFHTDEFLTTNQIMSQFSRLSAQSRKNSVTNYLKSTTLEEDDEDTWFLKTALEEN
jgi:hypothetical protein